MSPSHRWHRGPLIPTERLQPPDLDWSRELDLRRGSLTPGPGSGADAALQKDESQAELEPRPDAEPGAELLPEIEPPDGPPAVEAEPANETGPGPAPTLELLRGAATEPATGVEADPERLAVEPGTGREAEPLPEHRPGPGSAVREQLQEPEPLQEPERTADPLGTPDFDWFLRPTAAWSSTAPAAHAAPAPAAPPGPPRSGLGTAYPRRSRSALRPLRRAFSGSPPGRAASITVIALLAIACAGLVMLNILRIQESAAEASRQAATYSPPALAGSGARATTVTLLGDTDAAHVGALPRGARVERGLDGAAVRTDGAAGARYVGGKGAGATFEDLARSLPVDSRVVVLMGGRNDRSASVRDLATAVDRTIRAVQKRAPAAQIVVVGPVSPGRASPAEDLLRVRDVLRAAATAASAQWVDPIAGHWLGSRSTLTSKGRLSDAGKQELARDLAAALSLYVP